MKKSISAFAFAGAFLCYTATARAEAPPGADPALAPWFHSLKIPGTSVGCCDEADCRPVDARKMRDGHWQAFVDKKTFGDTAPDAYVDIPESAMTHRTDNPLVRAVLCWYKIGGRGHHLKCFTEPGLGT